MKWISGLLVLFLVATLDGATRKLFSTGTYFEDTRIVLVNPCKDMNFGADPILVTGVNTSGGVAAEVLLKPKSIATRLGANQRAVACTIAVYVIGRTATGAHQVYEFYPINRPWNEGDQDSATASADVSGNDCNAPNTEWLALGLTSASCADDTNRQDGNGGTDADSCDYSSTSAGSMTITGTGWFYAALDTTVFMKMYRGNRGEYGYLMRLNPSESDTGRVVLHSMETVSEGYGAYIVAWHEDMPVTGTTAWGLHGRDQTGVLKNER